VRLTLRRRVLIALLTAFPVGWLYIDIGWRLLVALLVGVRGDNAGSLGCGGSGLSRLFAQYNGCDSDNYHHSYAVVELIIGTALALLIGWGLARFVTAPLRQVTDSVEQLGPTNLGLRIRHRGARSDELRSLSDAIDHMLDRVSEGYEAQRRFASNASHELRTPLATQRALIEISLSSALTEEQLELLSRQLLATNERNEKLIDGLLTLAETDRGLIATTSQPLDRVAADAVETLRPAAKERGVELRTELAPATVAGELPLLDRLVTNLVHNAIKYNVDGGWVLVTVTGDGVLTVANSGPHVPGELVAGLFEPFRRMSGERLDHGGGVGLGLTIARSIVAAHGGSIDAQSNDSGGGLTVRVSLPR
jgi:signal transduction histidine kinase